MFRRTLPIAILGATLLLGGGCDSENAGDNPLKLPHVLSCPQQQYWNPSTSSCVIPVERNEHYALSRYKYVAEVAQDNPTAQVGFKIVLNAMTTQDTLQQLLQDGLQPAQVTALSMTYPSNLNIGKEFTDPVPLSSAMDALSVQFNETLAKLAASSFNYETELAEVFDAGRIWTFVILASAPDVLSWWDQHLDTVRYVQPLLLDIDKVQATVAPGGSL